VLSERELESRLEIYLEQYCKTVYSEANLTLEMAKTMIFPAAIRYQNELASACANLKLVGYDFDTDTLDKITELVKSLQDSISVLSMALSKVSHGPTIKSAGYCASDVLPAMTMVRKYADELESWVADDLWPLPTYQEMLFIK
jgi:glutamine synthetase